MASDDGGGGNWIVTVPSATERSNGLPATNSTRTQRAATGAKATVR